MQENLICKKGKADGKELVYVCVSLCFGGGPGVLGLKKEITSEYSTAVLAPKQTPDSHSEAATVCLPHGQRHIWNPAAGAGKRGRLRLCLLHGVTP